MKHDALLFHERPSPHARFHAVVCDMIRNALVVSGACRVLASIGSFRYFNHMLWPGLHHLLPAVDKGALASSAILDDMTVLQSGTRCRRVPPGIPAPTNRFITFAW